MGWIRFSNTSGYDKPTAGENQKNKFRYNSVLFRHTGITHEYEKFISSGGRPD
jgi:hypothetical protein